MKYEASTCGCFFISCCTIMMLGSPSSWMQKRSSNWGGGKITCYSYFRSSETFFSTRIKEENKLYFRPTQLASWKSLMLIQVLSSTVLLFAFFLVFCLFVFIVCFILFL